MKNYFSLLILALFALSFQNCKGKKEQNVLEYSRYISGYTQGMIRSGDPFYIRLESNKFSFKDSLPVAPEELLKITPKVAGTVSFLNGNTLEFRPTERFKNDQTYRVELRMSPIFDLPANLKVFQFDLKILPQAFSFIEGSLSVEQGTENGMIYKASIVNADIVDPEQIEKLVKADLNGASQTLEWEHAAYTHTFAIRRIARAEKTQTLQLTFAQQVKNGNDLLVEIPGSSHFSVLEVKISEDDPKNIDIIMSDNLNKSQDLQGLVLIEGISNLKYSIQGNIIRVYPEQRDRLQGVVQVSVFKGIQSHIGEKLASDVIQQVRIPSAKPKVAFIGKGVFTPAEGHTLIPFSAVGLKAVQLRVTKVFSQNMIFYLQENDYDRNYDYELQRVSRLVLNKKINLVKAGEPFDVSRWRDYTLNLADHLALEKGVVYLVQLGFQRSYTGLPCAKESDEDETYWEKIGQDDNNYDRDYDDDDYDYYYYPSDYRWEERDDPCSNSYYYVQDRFPKKKVIATSLGMTAKAGVDGKYMVAVNDLATTSPVENCTVYFYNFQNQCIDSARTGANGITFTKPSGSVFAIVAQKGNDKAFLKITNASSLSYSNFDVSGEVVQQGIKGFLYGERGVWRPGNDIYLSFILEDKEKVIPVGHPILVELYDPTGKVVQTRRDVRGEKGLYCFNFKTDEDAVTGYWRAIVKIGGSRFSKTIRVETVKPNRLSIQAELPPKEIMGKGITTTTIPVATRWLHGAKTSSLKTKTELRLSQGRTSFPGFKDYTFDDYARHFNTTTSTIYDGETDGNGHFNLTMDKVDAENAPGMLNALLTIQVFENSGDFSIVTSSFKYSPYTKYVGIKLPESEDNWYTVNKPIAIQGAVVTAEGTSTESKVEVEVYTLEWRWWWDSEYDNIGSYINRSYKKPVFNKTLTTQNGKFEVNFTGKEWGRYYVIARDVDSGHTCGTTLYLSYWGGNQIPGMATLLSLTSDKKGYTAGEKIKIKFPSSANAVALVSIENGKTIKDVFRVPAEAGSTSFEFTATPDMCPNVYMNVSLIQPHKNRDNDKPVRLYGVLNIPVEAPELHLKPAIAMDNELRPSQDFSITISETNGKPMNYTLAVVDEGLLAISSFKTPDPFPAFYAREALGVKTWDFYDHVFGAYGGRLEKAFAVGGDEDMEADENRKNDRFTPVVIFQGPFTLKAGEKKQHTLRMPEYIGEVRTMVIAEDNGRYGSVAKQTPVNQPLMMHVTMPRLFTPNDVIEIPVTLFAMKEQIKDVEVEIKTDNKIEIVDKASLQTRFSGVGEQIVFFKVKIKEITGSSTISFSARSGQEKATFRTDVEIRIPNPRVTRVDARELKPGESLTFDNPVEGLSPASVMEITSIPALNLESRLKFLIQYPHGCGEQITSAVYPQLMLPLLTDLSEAEKRTTELHIKEVISRLRNYQTSGGGFSYWAGSSSVSNWVHTYITDFLINAEKQGYLVPASMKDAALNYLSQKANAWRASDFYSEIEQSYCLYVLASAGKANLAAMNRMKEISYKNPVARWQLAGAYALCKHEQVARSLIANLPTESALYRQLGRCYGSTLRDNAIILQSMVDMDMREQAYTILQKMALKFASQEWLSTQESAFGLCAIGNYVKKYFASGNGIHAVINKETVNTSKTVIRYPLSVSNQKSVATVKNNTEGILHVRTVNSSIPLGVISQSEMSGMDMDIKYYRNKKPSTAFQFIQGEDISVEISIRNTGNIGLYEELAMTYMFPSGFEFYNERLTAGINPFPNTDNVDIRDDRVYLYFSLKQGETKKFTLRFNAAYPGIYLLPAVNCSAMYDNSITATLPGNTLTILRGE